MGLAIATSVLWLNGDRLAFYVRQKGDLVRLEDSGSSLFDLETSGVDTSTPARMELIQALCMEYGVLLDIDEAQFQTDWLPADSVGVAAIRFLSFLTRLQDLTFTTKERTAKTFRDDLISALKKEFGDEATITTGEAPIPALAYYTVDIVIKHRDGRTAAIFPGIGEQKALEAILFAKEIELKKISGIVPFLIIEEAGSKISKQTKAKALNSELAMAAWDGGERDVLDKVRRRLEPLAA
ncbi:hypothetical protein CO731_05122 [Aminobacter sp. MSH1]|nr:hypothetical protein CO731_05122 [Aminobacter sp. MSH1]CAI2936272.1 conserved protein of unknown function [Aminobacter niigataensis]